MMAVIRTLVPRQEIYSIDEQFADVSGMENLGARPRGEARVLKWTGIPTCAGIAPTKTLAKLCDHWAKVHSVFGASSTGTTFRPRAGRRPFAVTPVSEVWGVGGRTAAKLGGPRRADGARLREGAGRRREAPGRRGARAHLARTPGGAAASSLRDAAGEKADRALPQLLGARLRLRRPAVRGLRAHGERGPRASARGKRGDARGRSLQHESLQGERAAAFGRGGRGSCGRQPTPSSSRRSPRRS